MIPSFVSFIFTIRSRPDVAIEILSKLDVFFRQNFKRYEIIVVCNGDQVSSSDLKQTTDNLHSLTHLLQLSHPVSFETAALVGLDKAIGDFVFFLEEAKLDFPLHHLLEMMKLAYANNDVIFLSAGLESLDFVARCFYAIFNLSPSNHVRLGPSRLVLVSRKALGYALDQNHLIRFHRILFLLGGFQTKILSYKTIATEHYEIKSLYDRVSLAKELLLYYTFFGRNLSFLAATGFAGFALFVLVYALYAHFFLTGTVSGWTSLILFLSIAFMGLFLLLGIVVEYLQKILFNIQRKPIYNLLTTDSNFEKFQNENNNLK